MKFKINHEHFEFEELKFQVQTKEELKNNLLYLRTCMKLELDRKINDFDTSYIANLVEKKVFKNYSDKNIGRIMYLLFKLRVK